MKNFCRLFDVKNVQKRTLSSELHPHLAISYLGSRWAQDRTSAYWHHRQIYKSSLYNFFSIFSQILPKKTQFFNHACGVASFSVSISSYHLKFEPSSVQKNWISSAKKFFCLFLSKSWLRLGPLVAYRRRSRKCWFWHLMHLFLFTYVKWYKMLRLCANCSV